MSLYDIKKKLKILELFEKSTGAMKLISLSIHHQLKKIIPEYKEKFNNNNFIIKNYFNVKISDAEKVYVFVSAERSFCGDYVSRMFREFEEVFNKEKNKVAYIVFGKALMHKIIAKGYLLENVTWFSDFKINKFDSLYESIDFLLKKNKVQSIIAYYTESVNISNRKISYYIFNKDYSSYQIKENFDTADFKKESIIESFVDYCFKSFIFYIFYESFFSEQSARFIAMDSALNNAREGIIKNKKLYFKLRQQKINNQLQDIVSSLL